MTKVKIYLKNHHKRSVKLGEIDKDSSWKDIKEEFPLLETLQTTPYIRFWENNGTCYIDFGSHDTILVIKGKDKDEN